MALKRYKIKNSINKKNIIADELIINEIKKHLAFYGRENFCIDLEIVGLKKMSSLNHDYMGKIGPTDVLSFPLEAIPGEKKVFIGTIVICSDIIESVAKLNETNYADEFLFRVRHGIDHLLGIHH